MAKQQIMIFDWWKQENNKGNAIFAMLILLTACLKEAWTKYI